MPNDLVVGIFFVDPFPVAVGSIRRMMYPANGLRVDIPPFPSHVRVRRLCIGACAAPLKRLGGGREERGGTGLTLAPSGCGGPGRPPAGGQSPNSHSAVTGIGLGSNFKYLPDVDWVESAPAKERG